MGQRPFALHISKSLHPRTYVTTKKMAEGCQTLRRPLLSVSYYTYKTLTLSPGNFL